MKPIVIALVFTGAGAFTAQAAFTQIWQVGFDDGSQADFVQEDGGTNPAPGNPSGRDDDYYFAGNYGIGNVAVNESWSVMERALTGAAAGGGDSQDRWHFNLSPSQIGVDTTLRVTFDLFALGYWDASDANSGTGSPMLHDLNVTFNNFPVGSMANIGGDTNWVLTFNAAAVGATTGENILQINRTGGLNGDAADNTGWIQYDYVRMESETIPEPAPVLMTGAGALALLALRRRK